ncbi:metal ABC transporter permease [Limnoraphis robusta]|uniref:High-affinity zinc uptake system membrane protein ZnuB n=1 Tax=Limnoraphis robusta CS-951 TaxID=1637645 RepID=A0A0F5YCI7_9CYAN|nr:metal ABC transporter permease [Limnoraphis robusta]KKD36594.1 ABC transporter permease [Limnoraphis robusta CS-951]
MINSDWIELLSLPFMQRAIIGGVLLGTLGGLLGSFVVLRQLSMYGNALGHVAFLAVVIGAFIPLPSNLSLTVLLVFFGLGVIYLIDKTNLGSDTILGVIVAGSVALGTIGFSFLEGNRRNLLSVLFGDILAISNLDIILLVLLLAVTIFSFVVTLPQQILLTFSPDLAQLKGIPIQLYRYSFIVLLSLTLALSIRAVGILLVNAFLVIPAATARLVCQQFIPFLGLATAIGAVSGILGMMISGIWDLPSGPSIVLVQLVVFLVGVGLSRSSH